MPRIPNPCAKRVTPEYAYEVWQSCDGAFTYWVLKKYQSPQQEEKNPYAAWYVWATSRFLAGSGEYGDMYVSQVKKNSFQIDNPLCHYLCICPATQETLHQIGLPKLRATSLTTLDPRLASYLRVAVPIHQLRRTVRILQEHDIRLICMDAADFLAHCLSDVQTLGKPL